MGTTGERRMRLLNPGPVTLTERVRGALQRPDLCHREPEFYALAMGVRGRIDSTGYALHASQMERVWERSALPPAPDSLGPAPAPGVAAVICPHDDFSFSGLKTSVRYFVRDHPEMLTDGRQIRDLCASAQRAIVDVLVGKTLKAARRLGVRCITASGGVTCNRELRRRLSEVCAANRLTLRLAEPQLCTDNAGMIGLLAERQLLRGVRAASLDEEIAPNWPLGEAPPKVKAPSF